MGGGAKSFIKSRLGKIIGPVLTWTIVYLLFEFARTGVPSDLWRTLLSIPFTPQGHGVLWFMYTLAGLYLLTPILARWIERASVRELEFYLLLWVITLAYPLISLVLETNSGINGILYYFSGYAGYYVFGYYMMQHSERIGWRPILVLVPIVVATPVICKLAGWEVDFYEQFWYLTLFCLVQTAAWFKLGLTFGDRLIRSEHAKNILTHVSNLAFGIYLCHIFVMREFVWQLPVITGINFYPLQTLLIFVLSFLLSLLLAWLLSLLPVGQYLVACRSKHKH